MYAYADATATVTEASVHVFEEFASFCLLQYFAPGALFHQQVHVHLQSVISMGKMRLRAYESWHMQSIFCVGVLDKYLYSQMFAYKQVSAS